MGRWPLLPLDGETWMTEYTSIYFKKLFGFPRDLLIVHTINDGYMYDYISEDYKKNFYHHIKKLTTNKYKALEKKISTFYTLKQKAKKGLAKVNYKDIKNLTDQELIRIYKKNRDWIHRITVFDQFGFIAENYWDPLMENILVNKCNLKKESIKYNEVLFALTKPEHISTTLEEKRSVLKEVLKIKAEKEDISDAAQRLTKDFGWMPVFAYLGRKKNIWKSFQG